MARPTPLLFALLALSPLVSRGDEPVLVLDSCDAIRSAWRGFRQDSFPEGKWTCEDGVLRSIKGQRIDVITREEYEDFELELEWKVAFAANSGIMYGVSEAGTDTFWSGPEMQINDDPNHPDGLQPKTAAGALYDLLPANEHKRLNPTGEYNQVRIVSRQGHVEHWLNGAKILDYEWDGANVRAAIAQTKFAQAPLFMRSRRGHIALQSEGDEVWFRHIRIRRLPAAEAEPRLSEDGSRSPKSTPQSPPPRPH